MKFEINPNELTTEQRNHVSDFIRNWPTCSEVANRIKGILDAPETEGFKMAKSEGSLAFVQTVRTFSEEQFTPVSIEACRPTVLITEEQRLDAEQKADLRELSDLDAAQAADNLNEIFGTPDTICNTVPLDKEGLPWDSRIHSSSKAFIADGTWKLRRGVDPAEVAKVKAQLRELMAVPKVDPVSVPVPPAPKSHYLIDQAPAPVGVDAVVTHNPGHIDVDPSSRIPAPKSHYLIDQVPTVTLTDLISRIAKAIAEGRITQATVTEVCLKHQVSEFALLSNRPDLLPLIDADMKALGV